MNASLNGTLNGSLKGTLKGSVTGSLKGAVGRSQKGSLKGSLEGTLNGSQTGTLELTGPKPKGIKVETFRIHYLIGTPKVKSLVYSQQAYKGTIQVYRV